jgi:hypothetical protein
MGGILSKEHGQQGARGPGIEAHMGISESTGENQ